MPTSLLLSLGLNSWKTGRKLQSSLRPILTSSLPSQMVLDRSVHSSAQRMATSAVWSSPLAMRKAGCSPIRYPMGIQNRAMIHGVYSERKVEAHKSLAWGTSSGRQAKAFKCTNHQAMPRSAIVCQAQSVEAFDPQICVVLGTQWGDEGKGKLVDVLAQEYNIVARAQGGANAGHTIYDAEGNKYKLHLIPSGILNPKATCVVGNGVVVHLPGLFDEIKGLEERGVKVQGRLIISDRAHLLFELHKEIDGLREAELSGAGKQIGTTKRGIGPAYSSKATRNGIRVGDLANPETFADKLRKLAMDGEKRFDGFEYNVEEDIARYKELAETVAPYVGDTVHMINDWATAGEKILIEGANATLLDVDFGTYPFVTSSNPSIGGVISGLGIAPTKLGAIIGVAKAYTTRVGAGPYPTEIFGQLAEELREIGAEYGTTTGRPRRIGWLDMVALKYACQINGLTHLNITKLDVLSELDEIKVGVGYRSPDGSILPSFPSSLEIMEQCEVVYETLPGWKEDISGVRKWDDLPRAAQEYVQYIEDATGVHCKWIGVGPGRDALVDKPRN